MSNDTYSPFDGEVELYMPGVGLFYLPTHITYTTTLYWIICCLMIIVLNRTKVMASANNSRSLLFNSGRLQRSWASKAISIGTENFLRVLAIGVLVQNCINILVALKLHYEVNLAFGEEPRFIYKFLRSSFFDYDPEYYNQSRYMGTPKNKVLIGPSCDLYFPIFLGSCLLVFVETFLSVTHGDTPYLDTGITLFEQSFSFHEASVKNILGDYAPNRPIEGVLILSFLQVLKHLSIQIGALTHKNRYRLIPLTVLGLAYLGFLFQFFFEGLLLRLPVVLILSTLPQMLTLAIIIISGSILLMAIFVKGFNLRELNYASFLLYEENNNDEADPLVISVKVSDDFYTALANFGLLSISLAGRASYISELNFIALQNETWLERSLWEKVKTPFGGLNTPRTNVNEGTIQFLRENNISGYGNMISRPTGRLLSDGTLSEEDVTSGQSAKKGVIKMRLLHLSQMFTNLGQLIYSLMVNNVLCNCLFNFYKYRVMKKTREVSDASPRQRITNIKHKLPPFLRSMLENERFDHLKSGRPDELNSKSFVEIDEYDSDSLINESLALLQGNELSEVDNSADYVIDDFFSGSESEDESISSMDEGQEYQAFQDIVLPQDLSECLEPLSAAILRSHFQNDPLRDGILTRSKFSGIHTNLMPGSSDNDVLKLIDILLEKRNLGFSPPDLEDNIDTKFLCVICRTNTREIITWPCKCFAICNSCRLALVAKGFEGCVCCREEVQGVSKVFIP